MKKIKHNCQFLSTETINRNGAMGVIATCPICGECREVLSDGRIKIINKAWQKMTLEKN